jgi:hypothetical protein
MDMRMVHKILPPCVQDADKPDTCSKIIRVFTQFFESPGRRLKQDIVHCFFVSQDKRVEKIRNREDNMKVLNRQKVSVYF